jgi:hypothetical protein
MGGCTSKDGVHGPEKGMISAFKCPDEMTDFETLFPKGNSALKRHLTKEVWEEYKDQKDDCGVSFKTCIFSGVKNLDSGIGLYAGSHSSYSKFSKLFDAVVQEYHKHGPSDMHVSEMNCDGLTNPEWTDEEKAMVVSTRIRVGRNLEGFPLGPGVSKEQRLEIMNKVVEAANNFEGDLKGTFYPLEGMKSDVQKKLIADHFLFK